MTFLSTLKIRVLNDKTPRYPLFFSKQQQDILAHHQSLNSRPTLRPSSAQQGFIDQNNVPALRNSRGRRDSGQNEQVLSGDILSGKSCSIWMKLTKIFAWFQYAGNFRFYEIFLNTHACKNNRVITIAILEHGLRLNFGSKSV